jgi:hypothetical protein
VIGISLAGGRYLNGAHSPFHDSRSGAVADVSSIHLICLCARETLDYGTRETEQLNEVHKEAEI